MDPSSAQITPSNEADEWDTDGFVIPSLTVGDSDQSKPDVPEVHHLISSHKVEKEVEKIYLGPHGAPPSQTKQQELNTAGRKQRFKQKLWDNKVQNQRELMGGRKESVNMPKGFTRN